MGFSADLLSRARALKRVVVLPESDDERVLKAASKVLEIDGAKIILLGKKDEILARGGSLDLSKAEFIDIPKYLRAENLYIEKDCAGIRFYWQKDKVLVNYVYLTLKNGEFYLGTYGVTQKSFVDGQLKSQIIQKFVNGDGS